MCIAASVGRDGRNARGDVKTVQILVNMNIASIPPLALLDEDGDCGKKTLEAIEQFQKSVVAMATPDGRVSPGGVTLKKLSDGIPAAFCDGILKGIYINASDALISRYCHHLGEKMAQYGIDTPLRVSHFLAQVGHESGELQYCEELASGDAYEGRRDLGNTERGDGRLFKGRGLIQLTGRANYAAYSNAVGIDYTTKGGADLLATDPAVSVDVACWFWKIHGLNALADKDDVTTITKRINGGLRGFEDRKAKLLRAKFFVRLA